MKSLEGAVASAYLEIVSDLGHAAPKKVIPETALIGADSVLDSLALVRMLVQLESNLKDQHGIALTIADERAMSERNSPFRTLKTLTDYLHQRVAELS